MARKGLMEGLPENIPESEYPCPICFTTKATKKPRGTTTDLSNPPPGFMLQTDFAFSMLKSSVDLPRILWLYALILHTPLDLHPEASVHLLTS